MSHEIVNGTQLGRGYEIHSCLKNEATKISCVLDKGYNSYSKLADFCKKQLVHAEGTFRKCTLDTLVKLIS